MLGLLCGLIIAQAAPDPDATPDARKQWYAVTLNGWPVKVYGWVDGKQVKWWPDDQRFDYPPLDCRDGEERRAQAWYYVKVNGFKAPVLGWAEGPRIRWCDGDQAWAHPKRPGDPPPDKPPPANGVSRPSGTPADAPKSPAGQPFLFGVDASKLGSDARQIRASDPAIEAEVRMVQAQMADKQPADPSRVKPPELPPTGLGAFLAWLKLGQTMAVIRAASVAAIIATVVLLILPRRT